MGIAMEPLQAEGRSQASLARLEAEMPSGQVEAEMPRGQVPSGCEDQGDGGMHYKNVASADECCPCQDSFILVFCMCLSKET